MDERPSTSGEQEVVKREIVETPKAENDVRLKEREELKNEVLADLKRQDLKKEILDELKRKGSSVGEFLKHPAFILLAGFILTTVMGTWLSSYWQDRQWKGQQEYLKSQSDIERTRLTRQGLIKEKYDIRDQTIKAIAEASTAAEDMLESFTWQLDDSRRTTDAPERARYWQEASRNWRINSKTLAQKISFRFNKPEVLKTFDHITEIRAAVGNKIQILKRRVEESKGSVLADEQFQRDVYAVNGQINEVVRLAQELMKVMTEEIREDESRADYNTQAQLTVMPSR